MHVSHKPVLLRLGLVTVEILVLEDSPKSFYKDIIECSALTVHTDPDPILLLHASEILTGVLIALVCVR